LEVSDEVEKLADEYIKEEIFPEKYSTDNVSDEMIEKIKAVGKSYRRNKTYNLSN
jgi:hypothetical protein